MHLPGGVEESRCCHTLATQRDGVATAVWPAPRAMGSRHAPVTGLRERADSWGRQASRARGQHRVHTWHGTCRGGWRQQVPMGAGPCSDWEKAGVGKARETTPAFINTRKPGRVRWVSPGGDVGCRPRAGPPAALIGTTPGAPGAASCNRSRPCSAGSHNRSAVDAARAGDTPRRRWSRRRARELRDAKRRMAARRTTSRRRVQARRRDGPDPQRSRRKPRCPPPDTAAPHGRCQRRGAAPYGAGATCGTPTLYLMAS